MTMHLAHPSLSTTGKKRGKLKFKSAEAKREYERLAQEWADLKKSHGVEQEQRRRQRVMSAEPLSYKLSAPVGRTTSNHIPSRNTGDGIANTKQIPQYTGTKIIGIGTMHKSNAVPIFSDEEAQDISRMRRG
jgi:hypothetical protein